MTADTDKNCAAVEAFAAIVASSIPVAPTKGSPPMLGLTIVVLMTDEAPRYNFIVNVVSPLELSFAANGIFILSSPVDVRVFAGSVVVNTVLSLVPADGVTGAIDDKRTPAGVMKSLIIFPFASSFATLPESPAPDEVDTKSLAFMSLPAEIIIF